MCGEKRSLSSSLILLIGSPPHVRGKVPPAGKNPDLPGITPACAGKSGRCRRPAFRSEDHPRMCGEKKTPYLQGIMDEGSPPHVRGKVRGGAIVPA